MLRSGTIGIVVLLTTAATADAQSISTLISVGSPLPGGGTVSDLVSIEVTDDGSWLAVVRTGSSTYVTLLDGAEILRQGQTLSSPPGASLTGIGWRPSINQQAEEVAAVGVLQIGGGPNEFCLLYDGRVALREGNPCFATGALPGSSYSSFGGVTTWGVGRFATSCTLSSAADPANYALIDVEYDFSLGLLLEQLIVREGDILPGQSNPVLSFFPTRTALDVNRFGERAFVVRIDSSPTTTDAIYVDDELIAQQGQPSVVPGHTWNSLAEFGIDLTDRGKLAYMGDLDDLRTVAVYDGRIIVAEGDDVPGFPGVPFEALDAVPGVHVAESGEVLYVGTWGGSSERGLFLDRELLLRRGVTTIGGQAITTLNLPYDQLDLSPKGRYVGFIAVLANGIEGAFLIDRDLRPSDVCVSDGTGAVSCPCSNDSAFGRGEGCENSQGHGAFLTVQGTLDGGANETRFSVSQARPNQPAMLVQGEVLQALPFKDGILCMGNPTERIEVIFTDGTGHAVTSSHVAFEGGAIPFQQLYYQVWYRDPALSVCGTGSNFTQGVLVRWHN